MEAITFSDRSQLYEVKNNGFIFIVLFPISLIIIRVFFLVFIHHCYFLYKLNIPQII